MHVLTINEPFDLGPQGGMAPGSYLCEDRNAAEIMLRNPGSEAVFWDIADHVFEGTARGNIQKFILDSYVSARGDSILIIAPLGFGDAILLTPCLRAIKELNPKASLIIATLHERRQAFLGLPYMDGFEDYPLPTNRLIYYDCVLFLERAIEDNPHAKTQHMTDRFAQHLGLGELKDKRAEYHVSDEELAWVRSSFPRTSGKKRIGVQVQAGVRSRSYPRITLIVEALRRAGWEVGLLGRPGEFRADGPIRPEVVDLSRRGLTWRQSAAFLLTCDVFLGPDSSLLHVAGALNVPAVGLFGPYPWKLRTAYYTSVFAIQGSDCPKAPCFWTQHLGDPIFPPYGPCAETGKCTALESILPQRILAKVEQVYDNAVRAKK